MVFESFPTSHGVRFGSGWASWSCINGSVKIDNQTAVPNMRYTGVLQILGLLATTLSANIIDKRIPPTSGPFFGIGRLTALNDSNQAYMGCFTDAGLWTVDERQCGTFTGVVATDVPYDGALYLNSTLGSCGLGVNSVFTCGTGYREEYQASGRFPCISICS
jgi:hypothetical protein